MRPLLLVAMVVGAQGLACASPRCTSAAPAAASPAPPVAAATPTGPSGAQARVPRQYLVTVAAGAGEGAVREVYGRFGIAALQDLGNGVYLVTLSEDPGLAKLEELGRLDARVKAVQPNLVYRAN